MVTMMTGRKNMSFYYEKERMEAIEAGKRALVSLHKAEEQLESARNWGIVDILGGGFFTNLIKHSKMDNAQEYMVRAKDDLKQFGNELGDISENMDLGFNTSDFLTFADYFFDGLVADWMMQDRINSAKEQVAEAIKRVSDILHRI